MKFVVLALCVYAVSGASFNNRNNFGFKPWQTAEVRGVQNVQTGNYARATAQVSVPATQTVVETNVPVVEVAKTVVQPVEQVYTPVVREVSPVVQSRVSAPVVAKAATYVKSGVNDQEAHAEVLRSDTEVNPEGFQYAFETSNGIAASSSGELKKVDNVDALVVRGQYQYYSPEGVPITVTYVADENGFQPQSDQLPVAPPVPVAIARAVEYLRTHPPKEEKNY